MGDTPVRLRSRTPRRSLQAAAVATLVVMALVLPAPGAEAVTRPQTLYREAPVGAAAVVPGFPIDHVGIVFDLPSGLEHDHAHEGETHPGAEHVSVRFRVAGRWGAWQAVPEDGAQAVGQWTGALVPAGDAEAYQVRGVPTSARRARSAAINTTDGPREVVGHRPAGAAEAATGCRSRADWGADESLRTAVRDFAAVQVLTVHHTAGTNVDTDPDATVRAIYRYHTVTNGWDDIGYQALVSADGTVYEGRWSGSDSPSCLTAGGTTRAFGHQTDADTSPVVTGAHSGGHNTGNFGVALMGTFTDVAPTEQARTTLVGYLAELSGRHGLDPTGTVAYDNGTNAKVVDTIASHRDFAATECPGGVLYADLPTIRQDVATAMASPDEPTEPTGPAAGDAVATGETSFSGTVTGSFADTHVHDGRAEVVTEMASGGKPSRRTSLLDHVWLVPVPSTTAPTLAITASVSTSGAPDDMAVTISTDGGASWSAPVMTFAAGTAGTQSASLPPLPVDTVVHVRVTDTNRSTSDASLDTVQVDHLAIASTASDGDPPPADEPAEPEPAITLTASTSKVKGVGSVTLQWTGASEVVVDRDGVVVATASSGTWTDEVGKGSVTHTYVVCSTAAPGDCSAPVTAQT